MTQEMIRKIINEYQLTSKTVVYEQIVGAIKAAYNQGWNDRKQKHNEDWQKGIHSF